MRRSRDSVPTGSAAFEDDGSCKQSLPENGENGEAFQGSNELNAKNKENKENIPKMKKSNNLYQALNLPTLCNMNPRSVYNKLNEFHTFVEEEQVDCIFLSESWERDYLTLDKVIKLEEHTVVSNVGQRNGKGGRPAIIANHKKFQVENDLEGSRQFSLNPPHPSKIGLYP